MAARTVLLLLLWVSCARAGLIHHELQVELRPTENRFSARDTLHLPAQRQGALIFSLQGGLQVRAAAPEVFLERLEPSGRLERYRVQLPAGRNELVLSYGGSLSDLLDRPQQEATGMPRRTSSEAARQGVYLTGGGLWYPHVADELLTFSLTVQMPAEWRAISQGRPHGETPGTVTWLEDHPQEQIFLIAAPFSVYRSQGGLVSALAYLRRPDPELAQRYLSATSPYIDMYARLIGPYPYAKFALVENFWESGLGMPSFTLLGPRVIRFPFILTSSYPHEILHNWWGNSVFPDYDSGNWAEGLTAYLADHLLQEQRGQGAAYRQAVLQKYADYVSAARDFPLTRFTSRHDAATEAIGYGKTMMLFHMLRRQLGDAGFVAALQKFYARFKFRRASWSDLQNSFEESSGRNLADFFAQWVRRSGAPLLTIENARLDRQENHYQLSATIRQNQPEAPFDLTVPLALTLEGATEARMEKVNLHGRTQEVVIVSDRRPLRLDLDPGWDLFRKLLPGETPPAFSRLFGSRRIVALLPSSAPAEELRAWQAFAALLGQAAPQMRVMQDREVVRLPADSSVLLLGWQNRFRDAAAAPAAAYGARVAADQVTLSETALPRSGHSVAMVLPHPQDPAQVLAWVGADPPQALSGLARKLPHYGKYSFVAFAGQAPEKVISGRWPVVGSPLALFFSPERSARARLPEEKPLADLPPGSAGD